MPQRENGLSTSLTLFLPPCFIAYIPLSPTVALERIASSCEGLNAAQFSEIYNYWRMKRHMRRGQPLLRRLLAESRPTTVSDVTTVAPLRRQGHRLRQVRTKNGRQRPPKPPFLLSTRLSHRQPPHRSWKRCGPWWSSSTAARGSSATSSEPAATPSCSSTTPSRCAAPSSLPPGASPHMALSSLLTPARRFLLPQRAMVTLIGELRRRDDQQVFAAPVDPSAAPGYSKVVQTPMDLGTMEERAKGCFYTDETQLVADFHLMCSNALLYNPPCVKGGCAEGWPGFYFSCFAQKCQRLTVAPHSFFSRNTPFHEYALDYWARGCACLELHLYRMAALPIDPVTGQLLDEEIDMATLPPPPIDAGRLRVA